MAQLAERPAGSGEFTDNLSKKENLYQEEVHFSNQMMVYY